MKVNHKTNSLTLLKKQLEGELFTDISARMQYATDASAYREIPIGVAIPRNIFDLQKLIRFASANSIPLIPRAAGTSLAGQVVGDGLVVDISRYFGQIIELNQDRLWVKVQPGVILDELNQHLETYGLFFGPETSTSNRCMMGGMVGNNSCGSHSLIYGSTRDHLISLKMLLADGSEVEFKPLSSTECEEKIALQSLEGEIYRKIQSILSVEENRNEITSQFPDKSLKRRNTGYALDLLCESAPFSSENKPFNLCALIAGSEGTLGIITEITLNLLPVPPKEKAVVCIHLHTKEEAFKANLIALKYNPGAVEMMDNTILSLTKDNIEQRKNRFFVEGDPGAILIVEFARETRSEIEELAEKMEAEMRLNGYGYHFPVIWGTEVKKVWNLRKAGLGVLSNMKGDAKPVSVIEDTAVAPVRLPDYMHDFAQIMEKYNLDCVYHAHIGTGELHLRPILNLKDPKDVDLFRSVAIDTAHLVKRYKGSLSGEHGDGRLRGEFIPIMVGEKCYGWMKEIKDVFDPAGIFNPNKIVNTPQMNTSLRYEPGKPNRNIETIFDFSEEGGILREAEKCNGSGDCRKTEKAGGTMCPSYMASRNESSTTRARANILREFLTNSTKESPFDHKEIYEIMDLCLSCKGCKSECPSSVDMAKLKAEFLQHYYDKHGIPLRSRLVAYITKINALGSMAPSITNFVLTNRYVSRLLMKSLGFHPERNLPTLYKTTLARWFKKNQVAKPLNAKGKVFLFCDEFSNFNDVGVGIKAIKLLQTLGYEVAIPKHGESGRTYISKGLIRTAKRIANQNVMLLSDIITSETPLVGIEPSAILSFRDEYPSLVDKELRNKAKQLAPNTLLFEEFIVREFDNGNISANDFTQLEKETLLHGHCQQKSVASTEPTKKMLSIPKNYTVKEIPSGCCGMAGSFGYEKEHFELSMKVGELVLFPAVRKASAKTLITAPGTSCRHQIHDGTGRSAVHPIEILFDALK
ncbi:FAD-binding and (Fe-S)-binding domain-containing protein [Williamwhitmania taraxaci]|uniref:FAD/FMN-containing dehydrogenase n=1 Tax=Williamwhitmania taraxaci TaxID=1640674 RepID=A0A1G6HHV6_9BACT|nr:FAD-binding and (Fe-S)-binding domain-containing protein [Williamwhitmania taraxaci]SDB93830.1 FAD/FMN-containing dehydrogenase [Williamwhitmania taraxaci]